MSESRLKGNDKMKGDNNNNDNNRIASVYIKDGNIHLHNEGKSYSNHGGIAYELGRPLLDFVCYDPKQFDDAFLEMAEAFNHELAHESVKAQAFKKEMAEMMGAFQTREIYLFFYNHMFMDFIYTFVESPRQAVEQLAEKIPNSREDILARLEMFMGFSYPASKARLVEVVVWRDRGKMLYRAVKTVVEILGADLRRRLEATIYEIDSLIELRGLIKEPVPPMHYLCVIEDRRRQNHGYFFFLEKPFRSFYGTVQGGDIVHLYEVNTLNDLFRFEFIKMIEHDVFIKKCKNCGHFFIPRHRPDAEYCHRIFDGIDKRCNEVGAMIQYEKRVAENPILEMHKKAYRRFNSRTRTGKMSQAEFLAWSEMAMQKRDECLAGKLSFDEFVMWLEQGRVRKARDKKMV